MQESKVNPSYPSSFSVGTLMNPSQLARALQAHPEAALKHSGCWCLCGDVQDAMFALMREVWHEDAEPPVEVTAFNSRQGGSYVVFTHQLGWHQHRMLVPLYEDRVRTCFSNAMTHPLRFAIGNEASTRTAVLSMPSDVRQHLIPLTALCTPLKQQNRAPEVIEFLRIMSVLTNPSQLPSLSSRLSVRQVSLSIIMPRETMRALEESPED